MKILINLVGAFLIVSGCVWFLQGVNVIPGSFMTGQRIWAVYGIVSAILGALVIYRTNRKRSDSELP
jgi:uncharacterized membrane protein HdeD (DUF308 family)